MSTTELVKLSAAEMAAKIKAKEVSSRELVEAHLAVIESAEPSVKAAYTGLSSYDVAENDLERLPAVSSPTAVTLWW